MAINEKNRDRLDPLGEIFSRNPTEPLFHYTSVSGLCGIVKSKELWATDARYLNDWSEVSYIASIADHLLSVRRQIEPAKTDELRALKDALDNWRAMQLRPGGVYICSLSENANQLSQWRGYCPPGAGICIGFDSVELHTSMFPRRVLTARVCYEREEQERIVDVLLDYLLTGEIPEAYQGASRMESLQEEFRLLLSIVGPVFKHPGFREEAEWRLIYSDGAYSQLFAHIAASVPNMFPESGSALVAQYRERGHQLVPYVALPLVERNEDPLEFDSVFLGPCVESVLFEQTIRGYILSEGVAVQTIVSSGIPLRVS